MGQNPGHFAPEGLGGCRRNGVIGLPTASEKKSPVVPSINSVRAAALALAMIRALCRPHAFQMAAVDKVGDIHQDNVNISSISLHDTDVDRLNALAAVFNSSLFSALARLKSGLNDAGWRKFNRQYAELVPLPTAVLEDGAIIKKLSKLADDISNLQNESLSTDSEGARAGFRAAPESLWDQLDSAVEAAYQLTSSQKSVLKIYPRRVNRFDLLTRQTAAPEED